MEKRASSRVDAERNQYRGSVPPDGRCPCYRRGHASPLRRQACRRRRRCAHLASRAVRAEQTKGGPECTEPGSTSPRATAAGGRHWPTPPTWPSACEPTGARQRQGMQRREAGTRHLPITCGLASRWGELHNLCGGGERTTGRRSGQPPAPLRNRGDRPGTLLTHSGSR